MTTKTKLHLLTVRAKNFRSFGAQFIEIDLNKPKTLVVSSDNGAGKSTGLTHALTFAFFDKAYQKGQKKTSLLNSKNGKDCIVEVEFETKGSHWLVRRGIKPNVFDIMKDGVRVPDEAAKGGYQTYLESIIGMDDKVFFNTVVLGRDKFVPFNEMSTGDTRNFVEVLLDLGVFTRMNEITKEEIKEETRLINDVNYEISNLNTQLQASQRVISVMEQSLANKNADTEGVRQRLLGEKAGLQEKLAIAEKLKAELEGKAATYPAELEATVDKMMRLLLQLNGKVGTCEHTRDQFLKMTTCPTCEQTVSDARKAEVKGKLDPEIETLKGGVAKLDPQYQESLKKLLELREINSHMTVVNSGIQGLRYNSLVMIDRQINELNTNTDTTAEVANIATERANIKIIEDKITDAKLRESKHLKKKTDLLTLQTFLKDDGVKADIAKIYVPVLNEKVNEFLDALNLWVNIKIDEQFNIEMFAPDRKGQSISDLSTGQMRRIDLAMLLAWRDVAQMKSSVDTNLLIMDETLENLSAQGVADFVEFIENTYKSSLSLFVISQRKDEFSEYFDNVIEFALKDDFSYIV